MKGNGIAGCVSRTSTAPLDRIKTIYQARGGRAASTGLIGSFKHMLKEGGVISMWRGNGVNCIKIAPEQAFRFQAYETYKRVLFKKDGSSQPLALHEKFTAGALAGATSQTLVYPMEVLKTRMCLRKTGQYSSTFDCARKLYSEHGVWVFYRGYIPNLVGILPYAGIDLALYETFKNLYVKALDRRNADKEKVTSPPVYVSLTAGASSSVCGQIATYPLALIKTKLQAESEKISLKKLVQRIIKHEGIVGLYRGMGANMLKVIPAVSISYACYEKARAVLGI
uniref:Mitochondrial carrier protein n=1 Tax=Mesocestoides corti TaxID=53468 RepID=A0A5K3F6Q5_MESCO